MTPFAFVFPGQGSQSVGMLDAWGDHPAVRQTLAEASAALGSDIGHGDQIARLLLTNVGFFQFAEARQELGFGRLPHQRQNLCADAGRKDG